MKPEGRRAIMGRGCWPKVVRMRTFPGFRLLGKMGARIMTGARMTEHSTATGHDRFLRAVQKELAVAERREREFNKADREERAAKMGIPTGSGSRATCGGPWDAMVAAHDPDQRRRSTAAKSGACHLIFTQVGIPPSN
jgi:hypothetical protein